MKTLIKLLLFLLIAHAIYQFVPPFWRYTHFKQEVRDLALQSKGKSDDVVAGEVLQLAATSKVPIAQDAVRVRRAIDGSHTFIDAIWTEAIEFVPTWKYTWRFEVHAEARHIPPLTPDDVR